MNEDRLPQPDRTPVELRLARIEQRLMRIEAGLGLPDEEEVPRGLPRPDSAAPVAVSADEEEELEMVVGQNWFTRVGIVVLALGGVFALSLPLPGLPPYLPSLMAYAGVALLAVVAHWTRESFELLSRYLRGAGMALSYFATLRLFLFGSKHVWGIESSAGPAVLLAVTLLNSWVALRRGSAPLTALAMSMGYATAMVAGRSSVVFLVIAALSGLASACRVRRGWDGVWVFGTLGAYLTHLTWVYGTPLLGLPVSLRLEPSWSVGFILLDVVVLAWGAWGRRDRSREDPVTVFGAIANCALGYGVFLLHSVLAFRAQVAPMHALASLVFVALGVLFWRKEQSRASTFIYAMTGYGALSVALLHLIPSPAVFVWLSVQSVVVVATALWFRSRFIVVSNFLIYLGIVGIYMLMSPDESGISLVFGVVALVTARVLNWQQQRLELKTELMRNAYLGSAFIIFPYALYHLVPRTYVSVAWVGIAVVYYLLNFVVRSPKYRWMGHLTLLLTVLYVLMVGIIQLESMKRVLSFVVLGSVLMVVSLVFTRVQRRRRSRRGPGSATQPELPRDKAVPPA